MLTVHPPHPAGEAAPHSSAVWIDLINPEPGEVDLVQELIGVTLPTRDELASLEQSSRLAFDHDCLRVAAPVIAGADTDHPSLSQIGLIVTPSQLVSIHFEKLKMFEAVAAKYGEAPPASSAAVFAALIEGYVARLADLLEEARARLDQISHRVFSKSAQSPRRAMQTSAAMRERLQFLGRMGERISLIRESLLGVERLISFALDAAKDWFPPDLERRLRTARSDIEELDQFEEHLLGKVQFLLDAVLGFISIEQNDIFKLLTIASIVGIFPTLVAGWYGMNFQNMPEYHWAWGYQFGIGVIIASTILPLAWFKWRGWI
ncbi:MAG TPA: magnesium transporter CorA family protein [Caulobacteraceae bacterium]|nr:magnesium transporter CorA family protein [Caulobacteraceae bacterium]